MTKEEAEELVINAGAPLIIGNLVYEAFKELKAMRENLATTQARSTQLLDDVRRLRRLVLWASLQLDSGSERHVVASTLRRYAPEGTGEPSEDDEFDQCI